MKTKKLLNGSCVIANLLLNINMKKKYDLVQCSVRCGSSILLVATLLSVTGCGGGSSNSIMSSVPPPVTLTLPVPSAAASAPVTALPFRASVPLFATATIDSTLAGTDSNLNGVRDDVEKMLSLATRDESVFLDSLNVAKAFQVILSSPAIQTATAAQTLRAATCAELARSTATRVAIPSDVVFSSVFNTDERLARWTAINRLQPVTVTFEGDTKCN